MRRFLGPLLTASGLSLLALNCIGLIVPPIDGPANLSAPVPGYHSRSIAPVEALRSVTELSNSNPDATARALFSLLAQSYIHASSYEIKPWDNWFLWVRSLNGRSFRESSQDIDTLWKRGGGFCRQASLIYAGKALELGLDARVILLTGHVVAEVLIPGTGWRVVDPDLDIFWDYPITEFGKALSSEEIVKQVEARGFASDFAKEVARIYTSQDDNFFRPFPLDEVRYEFEMNAKILSWVLAGGLLLVGILANFASRSNNQ